MIIECINCAKKFDVDTSLIPETGRKMQCGYCKHIWFYNSKNKNLSKELDNNVYSNIEKSTQVSTETKISNNQVKQKPILKKSIDKINFGKFLSYILVLIISFVALIIVLETFKSSISIIFPNLELVLFNLFETLEDIFLFLKNLIL